MGTLSALLKMLEHILLDVRPFALLMLFTMGAATVEVTTDGKPPERLSLKGAAEVETPGGAVMATARVQRGGRALVVEKAGPRDGERTVETRTLQDDGALRCEFTHHPSGNAKAVTVVRFYTRA